jgi:acyl-coenzyme A thioesterase PaaI-like protein
MMFRGGWALSQLDSTIMAVAHKDLGVVIHVINNFL